jgi:hypothetical protein
MYIKSFFVLGLLGMCSLLNAQKKSLDFDHENKFRFGASAGVNLNKLDGKTFNNGFDYNYQLGAFIQLNLTHKFGIQPELHFAQLSTEFSNDGTDIYDDLFLGGDQVKAKLSYVKFQTLFNLNVGPSKRFKLQLGPQAGFLANENVNKLVNENQELFKKTAWAAIGGVWIQLPLIHLGGRFEQGITNINNIDNRQNWKRQTITIFAGVTF